MFTKPLKLSDNNKDTLAYYATELITTVTVFIVRDPVPLKITGP